VGSGNSDKNKRVLLKLNRIDLIVYCVYLTIVNWDPMPPCLVPLPKLDICLASIDIEKIRGMRCCLTTTEQILLVMHMSQTFVRIRIQNLKTPQTTKEKKPSPYSLYGMD
jgi:hypothetical protein